MFTGIVEEIGTVDSITHKKNLSVLTVKAAKVLKGTKAGDSIAVNGVCLTVVRLNKTSAVFDIMKETLEKTSLADLKNRDKVNLERALRVSDRLSGHFVSGHVDAVMPIHRILEKENYTEIQIGLQKSLAKYFVPKGSVCVDGISLTVGEVKEKYFSVYLIPFTKEVTTIGTKRKGDKVNIETDILAKYILNK
ncbi:MAG: riboflavin synthase [Candidatus Omnitrophica bacterium]|nr:riboflavin synthase [Candidatus Omnitrophota bacterium]